MHALTSSGSACSEAAVKPTDGTVTFLFTDIEGSTRPIEERYVSARVVAFV
jgi:hypothetical protein